MAAEAEKQWSYLRDNVTLAGFTLELRLAPNT